MLHAYNKLTYSYGNGSEVYVDFSTFPSFPGYDSKILETHVMNNLKMLYNSYEIKIKSGKRKSIFDKSLIYKKGYDTLNDRNNEGFTYGTWATVWPEKTLTSAQFEYEFNQELTVQEFGNSLFNVTAHEIGHILGASHTCEGDFLMFAESACGEPISYNYLTKKQFGPTNRQYLVE